MAKFFAPWLADLGIVFRRKIGAKKIDFTLGELVTTVGRRWRTLVFFGAIGLALALVFAFSTTPLYSASVVVGSVKASSDSDSNVSASALSGLLRATSGAQGLIADPRVQNFLMLMTSLEVSGRLEREFHLLRRLRASQWDNDRGEWKRPSGAFFAFKEAVKKALFLAPWSPPDTSTLADYLDKHVQQSETKVPGVYRVTLTDPNRDLVGPLLIGILRNSNDIMREADEEKAREAEAYLIQKLSSSSLTSVDQREALAQLLLTQEQRLLLTRLRGNYVAEPIDIVRVSKGPVWPPFILLLLAGALLGGVLAVILILVRE